MRLLRFILCGGVLLASSASASSVTFPPGSLIIPENSSFQTACGSVSAYGLVWKILQANSGFNAASPVTVYWVNSSTKTSINRCVPSNLHTAPGTVPNLNTTTWSDGCDITLNAPLPGTPPAVQVDYTVALPPVGTYYNAATGITNFTTTTAWTDPAYSSVTMTAPTLTQIGYGGAPFVISATDAPAVIALLQSGDPTVTPFTSACACGGTVPNPGCHYVYMHQATTGFTADVAKQMNQTPPKAALLDSGGGVASNVLQGYLANAGLFGPGLTQTTNGCPADGLGWCAGATGALFDAFDVVDFISTAADTYGFINRPDLTGLPAYKVFWAPHWTAGTGTWAQYVANGDGATTQIQNALNNIAHYANTKGVGLAAECASLESYEGSTAQTLYSANTMFQTQGSAVTNLNINYLNGWTGPNCTDPNYTTGSQCFIFNRPNDLFSQIGDFLYGDTGGHVHNYQPVPTSSYRPGVKRLASSCQDPTATGTCADGSPNDEWDFFSWTNVNNNPTQAPVLYFAGHSYTGVSVAGNRIMLNTFLNLGNQPITQERALSAPVGYPNPTNGVAAYPVGTGIVAAGTYVELSGLPTNPAYQTFDPSNGGLWIFPYTKGNFRGHPVSGAGALVAGSNAFNAAVAWDGDLQVPAPHSRNIFTYFGGQVSTSNARNFYTFANSTPTAFTGALPNGSIQTGWVPEKVSGDAINANFLASPNANCVDVLGLGKDGKHGAFGLTPGSDGICDLQEALQYACVNPPGGGATCINRGADFGGSEHAHNVSILLADVPPVQEMLNGVRGFCFSSATGTAEPTLAQCDCYIANGNVSNITCDNKGHLGGIVHSTTSIIGPSPNISDNPLNSRPLVSYVGGWDGMLHAIYLGGGAGYSGPAAGSPVHLPNQTANFPGCAACMNPFVTDWAAAFAAGTLPAVGEELWAFVPPTQLPWLQSNSAAVDVSPVVQDVFADFTGSGIREWHTVLVGAVGSPGNEVFALDVTNPLQPAMLWMLEGTLFQNSSPYPYYPVIQLTDATTTVAANTNAVKWNEPTADFMFAPVGGDPGRFVTGVYDFSDMGATRGISLGQVREGLEPVYAAYISAASSGVDTANGANTGAELFAVDASNGQKIWQFQEPYTTTAANSPPAVASLLGGPGGISRVYTGDMEGNLWELDAPSGMNLDVATGFPGCPAGGAPCRFTAFSTGSIAQPITTNVSIAKTPATGIVAGTPLAPFPGATLLMFGTGGDDSVPFTNPGKVHVLLQDATYRVPYVAGGTHLLGGVWAQAAALTFAQASGTAQEIPPGTAFPLSFPGEHMYGNITVAGQTVYWESSKVAIGNPLTLGAFGGGHTYSMDLGNAPATGTGTALGGFNGANYGGVAVFHQVTGGTSTDYVVGSQVSNIQVKTIVNAGPTGKSSPNPNLSVNPSGILYQLRTWMERFLQ